MKKVLLLASVLSVSCILANGSGSSIENETGLLQTIKCESPMGDFEWFLDYNKTKIGEQFAYSIDKDSGKYTNYKLYISHDAPNFTTLKGMSDIDVIFSIIPQEKKPFTLTMIRSGVTASLICHL